MNPEKFYQILDIEPGASHTEVKQAYKDLILVWHPDRFHNNQRLKNKAEEKIKEINSAYEFLKTYQPKTANKKAEAQQERNSYIFVDCEKLNSLLKLGKLKDADQETKQILLKLAGREKEGWLRPEDIKAFFPQSLSAIDQVWLKYSNGKFGFSIQRKIWQDLGCKPSASIPAQTVSENRFGQSVHWRIGSMWLSPWDAFNYSFQAPQGSFPREYIFALSGWWNYTKGWSGYLIWRFDEVFLKL